MVWLGPVFSNGNQIGVSPPMSKGNWVAFTHFGPKGTKWSCPFFSIGKKFGEVPGEAMKLLRPMWFGQVL